MHIKSLGLPAPKKDKAAEDTADASTQEVTDIQDGDTNEQGGSTKTRQSENAVASNIGEERERQADDEVTWDDTFESSLTPFLSEASIAELKKMYLEGPEPPRISDSGWESRVHKKSEDVEIAEQDAPPQQDSGIQSPTAKRGKNRGVRGRQRGRGGRSQGSEREDYRKVLSEVCHLAGQFCHFSHKGYSLSAQKLHGRLSIR